MNFRYYNVALGTSKMQMSVFLNFSQAHDELVGFQLK